MKRRFWFLIVPLFWATSSFAYLPAVDELRHFWVVERKTRQPLALTYQAQLDKSTLRIVIMPDGAWAKQWIGQDGAPKTVWKYRNQVAYVTPNKTNIHSRGSLRWDDWVFEPDFDTLIELVPRHWLETKGLGRHNEGYMWLFGAHHDGETNSWLGLLRDPLRPGFWNSTDPRVGRIEFRYTGTHRFPDQIVFLRENQPDYVLQKTHVQWKPMLDQLGLEMPSALVETAASPLQQ